jgi:hypothetical protein
MLLSEERAWNKLRVSNFVVVSDRDLGENKTYFPLML